MRDDLCECLLIWRERMIGNIKTDQLTFPIELFAFIHVVDIGQRDGFRDASDRAEQTELSRFRRAEMITADGDDAFQ